MADLAMLRGAADQVASWVVAIERHGAAGNLPGSFFHYGDTAASLSKGLGESLDLISRSATELERRLSTQVNGGPIGDLLRGVAWHADGGHRNAAAALDDARRAEAALSRLARSAEPDWGAPAGRPRM